VVFGDGLGGLSQTFSHNFKDGAVEVGGHFLVKLADTEAGDGFDFTFIGLDFSADDAEQGGFTFAVTAEQADALALVDIKTGVVEELRTAKRDGEIAVA